MFQESSIDIVNDSEAHREHAGYTDGETHFKVSIKSSKFSECHVFRSIDAFMTLGPNF